MKKPAIALILLCFFIPLPLQAATPVHGAAMHGKPAYDENFTHFNYANPRAPKGGSLTLHSIGTYDTFNPFVVKGESPSGIALLYDTLTAHSGDEPFSEYGLLAERFEIGDNRDYVVFYLNKQARFNDNVAVTSKDVAFSFDILIEKGRPFYKSYYADVTGYDIIDNHTIRFNFARSNPELALIMGQLTILPKHFWKDRDFQKTITEPLVGSGPYKIARFDIGKSITYERREDYWGAELAVNKGRHNFNTIIYNHFLDRDVALEAFKSHSYDFRSENSSINWATEYKFPAVKEQKVTVEEIPNKRPSGMQAFIFNIRRDKFKDPKIRQALAYAFDFEWSNKNLFHNAYKRSTSYFSNSELASSGLPSKEELKLLEPLKEQIPPEVFTKEYQPPNTSNTNLRASLREALKILKSAGWTFKSGKLINDKGEQLSLEFLLYDSSFVRIVNPMKQNLERMGMKVTIQLAEITQYVNRLNNFDFDMVVSTFGQSSSPGNEQRDYWHSTNADIIGSRNLIGIQNPAIDKLIDNIIFAKTREDLVIACRAMDRVLLWNHYLIPQFHINRERIAYWNNIQRPEITPDSGVDITTWWSN